MRTKTKFARRIKIPLCLFACWDAIPNPCYHHDSVMAAHSCGVLKERFSETRSLHPADAEHKGFGNFPTSILQRKIGICIDKCTACWYNVIDETKIVSSKTVIWLCRFPKHSNIEVLTGAESGKTACLVSIQELLTA